VTGDQPGEGFVAPAEDVVRAFWHGAMVAAAAPVGRMTPTCALVAGAMVSASGAQTTGMDEFRASQKRRASSGDDRIGRPKRWPLERAAGAIAALPLSLSQVAQRRSPAVADIIGAAPGVHGRDDLFGVDALKVDRRCAEVGCG
jgi:hypothetical protein